MAPTIQADSIISGTVYFAVFREDGEKNSAPYVMAAIHRSKEVGSLSFNRLIEIAVNEGRDVFMKKLIEKHEERPWVDLQGDFQVEAEHYWRGARTEFAKNKTKGNGKGKGKGGKVSKELPRPVVLESLYSFESFLKFIFARGGLRDKTVQAQLSACSHDMPDAPVIGITDDGAPQISGQDVGQEQAGYSGGVEDFRGGAQLHGGAGQGYEGAGQNYGATFQVVEDGQHQADFGLGGEAIYDPSVHNMSDSDTEVGPEVGDELPDVRFGDKILCSPPGV